jgi:predicted transcriptional regulator
MKRLTKKDIALSLHAAGRTVEEIARALQTTPSYVANALIAAGKPTEYSDLYTTSTVQNAYARMFNGVLRFKDMQAARESVARIDSLYHQFAEEGDRRGQHQAQLMALIGKNRAEGIGKMEEAKVFADWLIAHLNTTSLTCTQETRRAAGSGSEEEEYLSLSPYDASLAFA